MLCSVVSNFLQPHGHSRLLCPWNFPGKNTGVGCHFLFQQRSSGQEKVVRLSGMASLLTEWESKAWRDTMTCRPHPARCDEDILGSKQFSCHLKDCTLNPERFISREKVFGFHHICRGIRGLRVLWVTWQRSLTPRHPGAPPLTASVQPPSHVTCLLTTLFHEDAGSGCNLFSRPLPKDSS